MHDNLTAVDLLIIRKEYFCLQPRSSLGYLCLVTMGFFKAVTPAFSMQMAQEGKAAASTSTSDSQVGAQVAV